MFSKILIANLALVPAPLIASLYIGVMANRTLREKKQAAFGGALAYFIIMALFIFFGFSILSGFGITLDHIKQLIAFFFTEFFRIG